MTTARGFKLNVTEVTQILDKFIEVTNVGRWYHRPFNMNERTIVTDGHVLLSVPKIDGISPICVEGLRSIDKVYPVVDNMAAIITLDSLIEKRNIVANVSSNPDEVSGKKPRLNLLQMGRGAFRIPVIDKVLFLAQKLGNKTLSITYQAEDGTLLLKLGRNCTTEILIVPCNSNSLVNRIVHVVDIGVKC